MTLAKLEPSLGDSIHMVIGTNVMCFLEFFNIAWVEEYLKRYALIKTGDQASNSILLPGVFPDN